MNTLLQEVLTDPSVRNPQTLAATAANSASKFLPWATVD